MNFTLPDTAETVLEKVGTAAGAACKATQHGVDHVVSTTALRPLTLRALVTELETELEKGLRDR
jgi:hypothetical protein